METVEIPLVSIHCLVYNHEPYLRQCLDGFVMQKTSFKFEAIVHDDASTDGSADIIREYAEKYPRIIKPIYETENQYSKKDGSLEKIMLSACRGKYIAFCEGDDYWTEPDKLQKQVDFLEINPDYGMCYSRAFAFNEKGDQWIIGSKISGIYQLLKNNSISTLTVCLRRDLVVQYRMTIPSEANQWLMGDYPLWLWVYFNSKIHFQNESFAAYRVLKESASHSLNVDRLISFQESAYAVRAYYIQEYMNYDSKALRIANNVKFWSIFRTILATNDILKATSYFYDHFVELKLKYKIYGFMIILFEKVKRII